MRLVCLGLESLYGLEVQKILTPIRHADCPTLAAKITVTHTSDKKTKKRLALTQLSERRWRLSERSRGVVEWRKSSSAEASKSELAEAELGCAETFRLVRLDWNSCTHFTFTRI